MQSEHFYLRVLVATGWWCFFIILLAYIASIASPATADTPIHSFTIPTVGTVPALQVQRCGKLNPTNNAGRGWDYHACRSAASTGPRGIDVPEEVQEAIERIELEAVVHFDHDSTLLVDHGAVDVIAAWMLGQPDARLRIMGHTDATGDGMYNVFLSKRRAECVMKLFWQAGVPPDRIETRWMGEDGLAIDTPHRERANRRVTIEVVRDE